jgi:hypothetical protein
MRPLKDFLDELREDPEVCEALEEARAELKQKREELGEDAYYEWLLGGVERVEL